MSSGLQYPNSYFKLRNQGIRYKIEQNFVNGMVYYSNENILPALRSLARGDLISKDPSEFAIRFHQIQQEFELEVTAQARAHFKDILQLSLTEQHGAWHKVPMDKVNRYLDILMGQTNFEKKSNLFSEMFFKDVKPLYLQGLKGEELHSAVFRVFKSSMTNFSCIIYTYSTYFINTAYEIQFRERDPQGNFLYIWGTRPDNRRTPQCTMIEQLVNQEKSSTGKRGVSINKLKELVNYVANLPGFVEANPQIEWTPHYNCRSGIERVV